MDKRMFVLIAFVVVGLAAYLYYQRDNDAPNAVVAATSYEECVLGGFTVRETWPSQCEDSSGNTFYEDIGNELDKADRIRIDTPRPLQLVTFPLEINGEAVGTWFFEADFPIFLYDDNDKLISQAIATAQTDWMSEDFVEFTATIELDSDDEIATDSGYLVLEKDNPSGLEEYADRLVVPVRFVSR